MSEGLAWPPKKEDLERLYLVEGLSAAKIAKAYGLGLKYKSPKVAESTILYQLKKNGIARRDRAEVSRKVTPEMEEDWVGRYRAGESLKDIAGMAVDPVTVWNHLKKRGVKLRDKVEAQIEKVRKHEQVPFEGDRIHRAYLMGLRYGDLHAVRHGRAIRVRVSTTHPAMAELFEAEFSPYANVSRYPRRAKLVGFEWTLECDLDQSFHFMLDKALTSELVDLSNLEFLAFFAGLFDAEGTATLHKKKRWYDPEIFVTNTDAPLLDFLRTKLKLMGFHPKLYWNEQANPRAGIEGESVVGHLVVDRFLEAQDMLSRLPIRHREKVVKRRILLMVRFGRPEQQFEALERWKEFSDQIHRETREFIRAAAVELERSRRKGVSSAA